MEYSPLQLRYSKATKINEIYESKNFGESKGSTYDRVLIYPTKPILDWVLNNKQFNSFESKCKFYVAVTRAKYSVAIICDNNINTESLPVYKV